MTKKMTIKYWDSLSKESKKRALTYAFPLNKAVVDMLMNEKPDPNRSPWWKLVWKKVRIPQADGYRTVVNKTYIP